MEVCSVVVQPAVIDCKKLRRNQIDFASTIDTLKTELKKQFLQSSQYSKALELLQKLP